MFQDVLACVGSLHNLVILPVCVRQGQFDLHTFRFFCQDRAQFRRGATKKLSAQMKPGDTGRRQRNVVGFDAAQFSAQSSNLFDQIFIPRIQFEGPL